MSCYPASCSKNGQIKIQQMAFVLVAIMIFFGMVSLFYFSFRINNLRESAVILGDEEAKQVVRKFSSTPEFMLGSRGDCSGCIDLDKVMMLKNRTSYRHLWNIDYLKIEKLYPGKDGECTRQNYPNCKDITLIKKNDYGTPAEAFVALCRYEQDKGGYIKCEMGKIYASGKKIGGENE